MRQNLVLTVAAIVVMLATATAGEAAYIVTVTANHKAGPHQTSQPSGTGSVPPARIYNYRVVVDYGTFAGGNFNLWNQSPTGTATVAPDPNGNLTWQIAAPIQLVNPPAGLHVRARLQTPNFFGQWSDVDTAYASCP